MPASKRPSLIISRRDCERLETLLERIASTPEARLLESELARAVVVDVAELPDDVVTMESIVTFVEEPDGPRRQVRLTFPAASPDSSPPSLSILAPAGSALLGLRIGQSIRWPSPGDSEIRIRVVEVRHAQTKET